MPDPIKRRDFIKNASILGTSAVLARHGSSNSFFPAAENEIRNDFFRVSFDLAKGRINVFKTNETPFLVGASVAVNLITSSNSHDQPTKITIASPRYKHKVSSVALNDLPGQGRQLVISSQDRNSQLNIETRISLYDHFYEVILETICKNISAQDIGIRSIEPIRTIQFEGGSLYVPGVSTCITNGEMYFDAGLIHEFGNKEGSISGSDLKGVKLANGPIVTSTETETGTETVHSWWNAGLFSGYEKEGLVIGYLDNDSCLGNILVSKTATDQISFLAESVYAPELILKPGKSIRSNRVMINLAANPYAALEAYADAVGKLNGARIGSIINGWCSWFYTLAQVSEDEVIRNTAFAAKQLKPYGLEYIQIDEGYQKLHGDWEGNARFPHGMKWLADQIKILGFKPGIWISPYVISETTDVFRNHPEWLLKNNDGSPKRVGPWDENEQPPADEHPKRYSLDITHPQAAQWLFDLIHRIANEWGYEMIKIDFVAWSILGANKYYDPTISSAQAYRKGMEIMRKAAGEKCHILECGPGAITVGLVDSMRIEADVYYGFSEAAWNTYFTHPACSASAMGKRYYFHKRAWTNDADHVCLDILSNQQSEAVASLIALSGGNTMSGDRLTGLDTNKLEILKRILPSYGEAAFPVDLFDSGMKSVFALNIKKPFANWTVIGFFNAGLMEPVRKKFPLNRFHIDPAKTYLVFDFWKKQFLGEVSNELEVTVQPGSVTLLSLHEKTGIPQFISTDRHVLQGAIELEEVNWNENNQTISGTSSGPLNSSHNVYVYVPGDHPWTWGGYVLFRDYDSYSLKLVDKNIIRVHLIFEKAEKIPWEINCKEFFK